MQFRAFILLLLTPFATAFATDLPTTETPVARLALPIVPDSMIVSPDSARVAFAAKSGDATLEEKGVFINPKLTNPIDDSARPILNPICLYIDDKSTIPFDSLTPPVFSPNSQRLAFAGKRDKAWQLVLDSKTLTQDAEDVPANPIVFSQDSAHAAWVIKRGQQYFVTVDDHHWPPIDAGALGVVTFSPDSRHVALVANARATWTLYVDGAALPTPPPPPSPPTATRAGAVPPPASVPRLDRFGQFAWRSDSSGIAFYAAFAGGKWQVFSQTLDGKIEFASTPYEGIMKNSLVSSPDARQLAFATSTRNKWAVFTDATPPTPPPPPAPPASAPASPGPFDQILTDSIHYLVPPAPDASTTSAPRPALLYIAQQNKKWRLYTDHHPASESFDTIIQGSFILTPDKHHYAFAGTRDGQTTIIKDGTVLATHNEAGSSTFAFSPDSRHMAYAARNGANWFACVDGTPGAPFNVMTGSPIAFSPDSARVAYVALTQQKTWRLIVGKDAELQSKPYDGFLKGSHVTWRDDGSVVTLAIQKKVAMRIEARP